MNPIRTTEVLAPPRLLNIITRSAVLAARSVTLISHAANPKRREQYGTVGLFSDFSTCSMVALEAIELVATVNGSKSANTAYCNLRPVYVVSRIHIVAQALETTMDLMRDDLSNKEKVRAIETKLLSSILSATSTEAEAVAFHKLNEWGKTKEFDPKKQEMWDAYQKQTRTAATLEALQLAAQLGVSSKIIDVSLEEFAAFSMNFYLRSIEQAQKLLAAFPKPNSFESASLPDLEQLEQQTRDNQLPFPPPLLESEESSDEEEEGIVTGLDLYATIPEQLWGDKVFKRYRCAINDIPVRYPVHNPDDPEKLYETAALEDALHQGNAQGYPTFDQVQIATTALFQIEKRLVLYMKKASEELAKMSDQ